MADHTLTRRERNPSARSLRRYLATLRDDAWDAADPETGFDPEVTRDAARSRFAELAAAAYLHRVSLASRHRSEARELLRLAGLAATEAAGGAAAWSSARRRWLSIADGCADLRELVS